MADRLLALVLGRAGPGVSVREHACTATERAQQLNEDGHEQDEGGRVAARSSRVGCSDTGQRAIPRPTGRRERGSAGLRGGDRWCQRWRYRMSERPYLLDVIETLWPGDPVAEEPHCRTGGGTRQTFLAVPRGRSPSVLLPAERAAAAAAIRAYGGHGSRLSSLRTRVAGGVMASGLGSLLFRDRITVGGGGDSISEELERILGVPVQVAVRAGPPRANRKFVLAVVGHEARVLAFAKIGTSPLAELLVLAEGETLRRLAGIGTGTVRAPRAVHFGMWRDMALLVQEALPIQSSRPVGTAALLCLVRDLSQAFGTTTVEWGLSEHARRVRDRLAKLCPGEATSGLMAALDILEAREQPVTMGSWHGDLTSWNCAYVDGSVLVWDWERFETDVPVGFDLLHFRLQASLARARATSRQQPDALVATAASPLTALGLTPEQAAFTAVAYLIEIATRYLVDDQAGAGAGVGGVEL